MEVLRTAIQDFCKRSKGLPFPPADIVRRMFPEDWELFTADLMRELERMQALGLVEFYRQGVPVISLLDPFEKVTMVYLGKPK